MNSKLEAVYGPNRAAARPSTHEFALFYGDPNNGGVEITGGGYARVTIDGDTDWLTPDEGAISTVFFALPDTTDEWSSEATHWALIYDDSGDVIDDSGPLAEVLVVTGVGVLAPVQATVRFADSILTGED